MEKMNRRLMKLIMAVLCIVMMAGLSSCAADAVAESSNEPAPETSAEPESRTGKKIYFAGPMFSQGEKDFNLKLVKVLEDNGYEVFLPQRDGIEAATLEGKSEKEKAAMIFEKDVSEIMKADILIMLVDGRVPDEGACVELGIGYANQKRCYGLKTDTRSIEIDLDLNPMISECFIKIFKDFDGNKLIEQLKQYLAENDL